MATTEGAQRHTNEATGTEEAFVRKFIDNWANHTGADDLADRFIPLFAPEHRCIQPQLAPAVGSDAWRECFVRPVFMVIPDLHATVERYAVAKDLVFIEAVMHGTLAGRPIAFRVCDRISLRNGFVIERETHFDPLSLLIPVITRPRAWPRYVRGRLHARRARRQLQRKREEGDSPPRVRSD